MLNDALVFISSLSLILLKQVINLHGVVCCIRFDTCYPSCFVLLPFRYHAETRLINSVCLLLFLVFCSIVHVNEENIITITVTITINFLPSQSIDFAIIQKVPWGNWQKLSIWYANMKTKQCKLSNNMRITWPMEVMPPLIVNCISGKSRNRAK